MAAPTLNEPRFPVLPTLLVMNIFPLVGVLFFSLEFLCHNLHLLVGDRYKECV